MSSKRSKRGPIRYNLVQTCSHVGAALFKLADLVSTGCTLMPDDPTCTEKLCKWTDPKGSMVKPKLFQDIRIKKNESESQRRTADEYGQTILGPLSGLPPSVQDILQLRQELFNATQSSGKHVAAVHVLTARNFGRPPPEHKSYSWLPDVLGLDDPRLVPSQVLTVSTRPAALARLPINSFLSTEEFVASCQTKPTERRQVEILTRGQSNNLEWFELRRGSLTSTTFHRVKKIMNGSSNADPQVLVKDVMGDKFAHLFEPPKPNRPSLKWGISKEGKARDAYTKVEADKHKNLRVQETGLIIHRQKSYLRASPDGMVLCDCCESPKLLEIKAPFSVRNEKIDGNTKIKYLRSGTLCRDSSDGYYDQIQGTMAITGLRHCDFVVWTLVDMVVIPIKFDSNYWEKMVEPHLDAFFSSFVVPELYLRQGITEARTQVSDNNNANVDWDEEIDDSDFFTAEVNATPSSVKPVPQAEPSIVICSGRCHRILPEPECIAADNSDASVGCECPCGCNAWSCWSCAAYDQDMADEDLPWVCVQCVRGCDCVYSNV